MPPVLITLLTGAAAVAGFGRPVRLGFPIVVATTVLIPAPLVTPNGVTAYPTVTRVLFLAVGAGLLVALRDAPALRERFRPIPIQAVLLALLAVGLITGIGMALPVTTTGRALFAWTGWLDQALYLTVCLACVRAHDDLRDVAWIVTIVLFVSAGIAMIEHFTSWSWGRWLFSRLPAQQGTDAASELGTRGGQVRVRAGAEFALEYAWTSLALLPIALAGLLDRVRRSTLATTAFAGIVVLAMYWSFSRSAFAMLPVTALLFVALAADRRLARLFAVFGSAAAGILLLAPGLLSNYTLAAGQGPIDIRTQRLPEILRLTAERPYRGLGLGVLEAIGFPSTDSSYLLTYAEIGVIGLTVLAVLVLVTVTTLARATFVAGPSVRPTIAAAASGTVTLAVGAFAFDAFHVLGAARVFWLIAAIGIVAATRISDAGVWPAWPRTWRARVTGPVAAGIAGAAIVLTAPILHVRILTFHTIPTELESRPFDPVTHGTFLINTTCGALPSEGRVGDAHLECRDLFDAAGVGRLRILADSDAATTEAAEAVTSLARDELGIPDFRSFTNVDSAATRTTPARTAPVWLPLGAALLAVTVPGPLARRDDR